MYLAKETIERSFYTLKEMEETAKTGMERTSALFFLLAFDMTQRGREENVLPMWPSSPARKQMSDFYCQLVAIPSSDANWMVTNLGEINYTEIRTPHKKIGCDFFTTPLKRASEMSNPGVYPRRPANRPLFRLGVKVLGGNWGIEKHLDYLQNIPYFLVDRRSSFPWTALAIFVLRETAWPDKIVCSPNAVASQLRKMFTKNLCDFWEPRIVHESKKFIFSGGAKFDVSEPLAFL